MILMKPHEGHWEALAPLDVCLVPPFVAFVYVL